MKIKKMNADQVIEALRKGETTGQVRVVNGKFTPVSENAYHLCLRLIQLGKEDLVMPDLVGHWASL